MSVYSAYPLGLGRRRSLEALNHWRHAYRSKAAGLVAKSRPKQTPRKQRPNRWTLPRPRRSLRLLPFAESNTRRLTGQSAPRKLLAPPLACTHQAEIRIPWGDSRACVALSLLCDASPFSITKERWHLMKFAPTPPTRHSVSKSSLNVLFDEKVLRSRRLYSFEEI